MALVRLQRYLAMSGVASRRHAEDFITKGSVRVNGRVVTELGTRVDPDRDTVTVAGRRIMPEEKVYLLMNKPAGTVSTMSDPEGRPTVADLLPGDAGARVFPIGRLDWASEGALLFTNDGELAQALIHSGKRVEKTYHVKVKGLVPAPVLERVRRGVRLEDGTTPPASCAVVTTTGKHTWLEITLAENRPRQVPRLCEAVGHPVLKLIRVAFAGVGVEGLPVGETRPLTDHEIAWLRRFAGVGRPRRSRTARARHGKRGPRV